MEQHPVPQQISSYQFRLVGDMTLKQFFELAGGVLVAILFYASPLPGIFKWPLIIVSVLFGIALAFLPIEERPLEVWVIAFFRSIYSPTKFSWKKIDPNTKFFIDNQTASAPTPTVPTAPTANTFLSRLEEGEKTLLSKFSGIFTGAPTTITPAPVPTTPQVNPTPVFNAPAPTQAPVERVLTVQPANPEPISNPILNQPTVSEPKQSVIIPQTGTVTIPAPERTEPAVPAPVANAGPFTTSPAAQVLSTTPTANTTAPQFSPDAAPPIPPTQANIIVGQVMDANAKIIEGAILEVKDLGGRPVRALKSNRAGHFQIVTPLTPGTYDLIAEKEGMQFDPVKIEASGNIIPPIAIKAKA